MTIVADHIGTALKRLGVDTAFGLVGSGNFFVTHAMAREGIRFIATRHECTAVAAADGYGRVSGRIGVASVHTGPGLTNTILGLGEAVKSHTPLVVLSADVPAAARGSNSRIDQHDLVESVGAIAERVHSPASVVADVSRAFDRAAIERRPVVLMLPTDIQETTVEGPMPPLASAAIGAMPWPSGDMIAHVADLVEKSARPVIIAGRGAVLANARRDLETLGERIGAILATSAMANGLFSGNPWNIAISGGFSTPLAADLIPQADLILAFGATLNQWTTRNGSLLGKDTRVVQFDLTADIRTSFRNADVKVIGDASAAARLLDRELDRRGFSSLGFRSNALKGEIEGRRYWNNEPYESGTNEKIDPRALSIELDRILPSNRILSVDGGHFLGYPPMYIRVPDPRAFVFPNAFMPIGLGLGAAIGAAAATARPLTVAAVGDGGMFMTLGEIDTIARYKLPILVVIYNDAMAGAEAHHYGPLGYDLGLVSFTDADFAGIASSLGIPSATIRSPQDLAAVEKWAKDIRGPMVIDAKIDSTVCAAWLEEAFRNSDHPIKHEASGSRQ